MKIATAEQAKRAIQDVVARMGWVTESLVKDTAAELLADRIGGNPDDHAKQIEASYQRDFKVWGAN